MSERPIIFSTGMVRAILDGRKTQTRRVIKGEPNIIRWCPVQIGNRYDGWEDEHGRAYPCPYGRAGDRLWVRETFNWSSDADLLPGENHKKCPERGYFSADNAVYRADGERAHPVHGKALWLPSVHMPRWASRITLEITDILPQRLQTISEDEAIAEGMETIPVKTATWSNRQSFSILWDSIYSKRGFGWDSNPWVWVVEFERVR